MLGSPALSDTQNDILAYNIHPVVSWNNDVVRFSGQSSAIFVDRIYQRVTRSSMTQSSVRYSVETVIGELLSTRQPLKKMLEFERQNK